MDHIMNHELNMLILLQCATGLHDLCRLAFVEYLAIPGGVQRYYIPNYLDYNCSFHSL